jgi:hypothetical protein
MDSPLHHAAVRFDSPLQFSAVRSDSPLQDAAGNHIFPLQNAAERYDSSLNDAAARFDSPSHNTYSGNIWTPRYIMQRGDKLQFTPLHEFESKSEKNLGYESGAKVGNFD